MKRNGSSASASWHAYTLLALLYCRPLTAAAPRCSLRQALVLTRK